MPDQEQLPTMPNIAVSENLRAMNIDKHWTYLPPLPPFLCVSRFWFSIFLSLAILAFLAIVSSYNRVAQP
jgi:hypothetical protein